MPPSVTLRVGPIGGLGHRPLSHSRQSRWGGCGATPSCTEQGQSGGWGTAPCHAQSRAHQGVGELPPVTHRVGPIGELAHRPLSHTQQGGSGGWGAALYHPQSRADQGVGAPPLSHSGQGRWGGYGSTPSHTEQGPCRGGVGAPPSITHRAGPIRGLGRLPLSRTEQGG
uniref:Uncharacterized protein n=1 Tax=Myotis myotis TaxID=51298 RepID=A0A7J8ALD9_MYOMY|nr:hypothetical protein mMyoMyo1_007899 [Myotis myotis]